MIASKSPMLHLILKSTRRNAGEPTDVFEYKPRARIQRHSPASRRRFATSIWVGGNALEAHRWKSMRTDFTSESLGSNFVGLGGPLHPAIEWLALSVLAAGPVGYTMRDIRYKWNSGLKSVGISKEVELPQFRVLGHRQRQTVINLTTGNIQWWM